MSLELNEPETGQGVPPETAQDADLDLPIQGFKGTPDEIERQWFEKGRGGTFPKPQTTKSCRARPGWAFGNEPKNSRWNHGLQLKWPQKNAKDPKSTGCAM